VGDRVQFSCSVTDLGDHKVAWLHADKGTLAVQDSKEKPVIVTQNKRVGVSYDSRSTYHLRIQAVQESDAGVYVCQINTAEVISVRGRLSVVGKITFFHRQKVTDT